MFGHLGPDFITKYRTMPEITVLMSVYNGERWIIDSINSVLSQSEDDFEFIIINDGSTDDTAWILDSYNDERLVIINQNNVGLTKSLNTGLSIAKGNFIARIDADDICMPDRLYEQKKFLVDNPDVVLVGSNAILIDEKNNEVGHSVYPVSSVTLIERLRSFQPVFPHSSIFFRKEIINREGGYNPYFERSQDFELLLRLSEKYLIAGLDEFLIKFRLNNNSLSYGSNDLQLKMGIAALICYYRREIELKDFSISHYDDWLVFFRKVEDWLVTKNFSKRREAKKKFRHCRMLFRQKEFLKALSALFASFRSDNTFFLYRGINLNSSRDFEPFLHQL